MRVGFLAVCCVNLCVARQLATRLNIPQQNAENNARTAKQAIIGASINSSLWMWVSFSIIFCDEKTNNNKNFFFYFLKKTNWIVLFFIQLRLLTGFSVRMWCVCVTITYLYRFIEARVGVPVPRLPINSFKDCRTTLPHSLAGSISLYALYCRAGI